ncbi:unnamed protein product [Merluccius merluccius]
MVSKTKTTPLHLQSDGLDERWLNRSSNPWPPSSSSSPVNTSGTETDHLPLVLWSYPTAVPEPSECLPSCSGWSSGHRWAWCPGPPPEPEVASGKEMDFFGRLRGHLQVVHDHTHRAQANSWLRQKGAYDTRFRGQAFLV